MSDDFNAEELDLLFIALCHMLETGYPVQRASEIETEYQKMLDLLVKVFDK